MTDHQSADIAWRGGVPVARRFDDPYFSLHDGLAEARHVFLAGNDLPGRLVAGFRVAELGFGTGLNMLALALAWPGPGPVRFTSFEAWPMQAGDIETALAAFPEARAIADPFLEAWAAGRRCFVVGALEVEVIVGDARDTLARWPGRADAWFLDGFAPVRNPELWQPDLLREVARHTAPGGSFATYSAAGHVRRTLGEAGFAVERAAGFGRKRHMSRGRLPA